MITLHIQDNSPQAQQFLEFARTLPYVSMDDVPAPSKRSWAEASKGCITHEEFIGELRRQVDEHFAT